MVKRDDVVHAQSPTNSAGTSLPVARSTKPAADRLNVRFSARAWGHVGEIAEHKVHIGRHKATQQIDIVELGEHHGCSDSVGVGEGYDREPPDLVGAGDQGSVAGRIATDVTRPPSEIVRALPSGTARFDPLRLCGT